MMAPLKLAHLGLDECGSLPDEASAIILWVCLETEFAGLWLQIGPRSNGGGCRGIKNGTPK